MSTLPEGWKPNPDGIPTVPIKDGIAYLPTAWLAEQLRQSGYLILAPSDTSPVAELVRAIVDCDMANEEDNSERHSKDTLRVCEVADLRLEGAIAAAEADPNLRAWVERGLK